MRPKLREDCVYVAVEEGVYLETATGQLLLPGEVTFQLLDRIAPYLDGERTLASLTAPLPDSARTAVLTLVEALSAAGMVRDVDLDLPHQLTPAEREQYAEEIAFVEVDGGSGAHRFERFRAGRVLVVGDGPLPVAVLDTLWRIGLRTVSVAVSDPAGTVEVEAALRETLAQDPARGIDVVDASLWSDAGAPAPEALVGYDGVVHCASTPMLGRAALVSRAAGLAKVPVVNAVVTAGTAWIGPIGADPVRECWECGWLRLLGAMDAADATWSAHQLVDRPEAPAERYLSRPLIGLIAAVTAFGHFRSATRAGLGQRAELVRLDLRTAESEVHRFLPHPLCPSHRPGPPVWAAPLGGTAGHRDTPAAEALSQAAVEVADDRLGPLLGLTEGPYQQLPLRVVEATFADPCAAGAGPIRVVGAADTDEDARRRAVVLGCELAAERLAAHPSAAAGKPPSTAAGRPPAGAADRPPAGGAGVRVAAGAGSTWPEAVGRALLRHCHRLTAASQDRPGSADPPPPEAVPLVASTDLPLASAALLLDSSLTTVDLSSASGVHAVGVFGRGKLLASASALTGAVATRTALETAVLRLQGVTAAADIPPDLDPAGEGGTAWARALPGLVAHLAERGWRTTVAAIDVDPALNRLVPHLVAADLAPLGETPC
ncbi:TOMM precursor leader peptide-binding protein [Micromonospora sp. WMMD1102]|uniref:TOMM precursor leader peptide-binding protein n=1 Tax=Micromonospora sp. WMMD1102 TaxID=3016105 RepID=UPI0024154093|nr:TOMM precursor leader peptide-binding protein [Micromonospora sp. WMMD1102]MDG4788202.1 TOMM precursor leader peptide-binding protein [Micromonospora sp. WMMD1102]